MVLDDAINDYQEKEYQLQKNRLVRMPSYICSYTMSTILRLLLMLRKRLKSPPTSASFGSTFLLSLEAELLLLLEMETKILRLAGRCWLSISFVSGVDCSLMPLICLRVSIFQSSLLISSFLSLRESYTLVEMWAVVLWSGGGSWRSLCSCMLGQVYRLAQWMWAMEVMGMESLLVLNDSRSTEVKSQEGFLQLPRLRFTIFIQQYLLQKQYHFIDRPRTLLSLHSLPLILTTYLCFCFQCDLLFHFQMLSSEFSGEQDWSNFQGTCEGQSIPASTSEYESAMQSVFVSKSPSKIDPQVLKHHRISITHNSNVSDVFGVYEKDCYISIKKQLHYGTHIVYNVVLANFLLEIHLLNIHRSSDQKDLTTSQAQIGSGGFGSVRRVKAGEEEFAVKRINFVSKAQRVNGFDIETESVEYDQIQKAIRQYSLFKICSMLQIGPKVLFQSYDIICFNNCMEFTMELCHSPSSNPRFMTERGISMQKLERDLMENLKVLHSLKIVHKDIKPENILFSSSLNRFVFADFGITHAVVEGLTEKSWTNFAGTMEYCSQEMREIMSTGMGYVNLYLNDFFGLSKSIAKFQQQSYSSCSISHNAMSYNQSNDNCYIQSQYEIQCDNSIQQWFESECPSYNTILSPKKDSTENIYITSTHSLDAPTLFSSQINFYESQIIYKLIKTHDFQIRGLSSFEVVRAIDEYSEQINDAFILEETKKYVIATFYPSDKFPLLSLKIIDLKNTARNYGPKSEETLRKIQEILQEKETKENSEIDQYFRQLKKEVIENKKPYERIKYLKQLLIHLYLKNYTFVIGCGIRIIREAVKAMKKRKEDASIDLAQMCKIYIICNRLDILSVVQKHLINELFLQVWDFNEYEQLYHSISQEIDAHNYSSRYRFHQNPVSNRITAKLMRHAISFLITHQKAADLEVIHVFQYFLQKYDWTDSEDFKTYNKYLADISNQLECMDRIDSKRCIMMVEIAKIYRKMCRLQNHIEIDKQSLVSRVNTMVDQLRESSDKKYYFSCASQLIWMKYENGDYETDFVLEVLEEAKAYECTSVEKNRVMIQLNQIMGGIYIKKGKFTESFQHLLQTQNHIKSLYGVQNLSNSYYECLNNIAYLYHHIGQHQQALTAYQHLLSLTQTTNKVLTYEKSMVYRAIITIRIQMGVNKDEYPLLYNLIKDMVYETIFALISLTTSDHELKQYVLDATIFNFIFIAKHTDLKIFVMKALLRHIENYLQYFQNSYDKINYQLNKIYVKELKQPSRGLAFIWNYIKVKILNFNGVTREDFKLMNDFINNLIKNNSSRRALIILKKYIFHIPIIYYQERKSAFRLFHKVHFNIGHPLERVAHELIARDCQKLYSKDFGKIYKRENTQQGRMTNLLLKKWLARL